MPRLQGAFSNFTVERTQPMPDNTATLVCRSCGDTMKQLRTIPRLGVQPELLVLVCPSCQQTEIMEDNRGGVRPA
jgi:hypothetical protein